MRIRRGMEGLVLPLIILFAISPTVGAQQKSKEDRVQTVDMGSFKVNTPTGGGWKVTLEKDKGHILLEKKQTGLIRSLSGTVQDASIDVYEIKPSLEAWSLDEARFVSRLDEESKAAQEVSGTPTDITTSQVTLKDKDFHVLSFTIRLYNPEPVPFWYYTDYLYVPPQYKKTHVLYSFVYAHGQTPLAGMVSTMKLDPLLEVIDSFQMVDPLASIAGDPGELLRAAAAGGKEAVAGLLDKGVDVNAAFPQGTALGLAALFGHRETVDLLLDKGADINKSATGAGAAPLACAVMGGETELAGCLIDKGAAIDLKTKDGLSPLILAVATGQEELAAKLIEKGADVRQVTADGKTALHLSAASGQVRVAGRLVEAGADMNAQSADGWTPLVAAIQEQHFDVAALLMDKGADVKKQRPDGWAAIFSAADAGSLEMVKALVDKGADINVQTKESKRTPLIEAIIAGYPEIARFFVEKGANVNVKTKEGYTALKIAKAKKYDDLVEMLKKAGAK
jgi:ankyrin repeat protein